jgi:O-antigen ligase
VTLAVGVSFYLVASTWPRDSQRLERTLRWINWSGMVLLLWCLVQAFFWYSDNRYPDWLRSIHELYSIGPLYRQRVSGFALEPSWLAHQLNLLYLPLWLAATVQRTSAHRLRVWKISLENILLVGGVVILLLTLSRIGMLAFLAMVAYLLVRGTLWFNRWLQNKALQSRLTRRIPEQMRRRVVPALVFSLLALAYLLVFVGTGLLLSRIDTRMASLFQFKLGVDNPILQYANQLLFAARLVYWEAGWNIFNAHPILGVGLGDAGFYFAGQMSPFAWGLMEVRDLFYRTGNLLNIKSLWVRLLAETGIVGFSLFIAWLLAILSSALKIEKAPDRAPRVIALAGQMAIIGLVFEGFSVDTFAFPYFWFLFGLVTVACIQITKTRTMDVSMPVNGGDE